MLDGQSEVVAEAWAKQMPALAVCMRGHAAPPPRVPDICGQPCGPRGTTGKDVPAREALPAPHRELVDWYFAEYAGAHGQADDPVLALRGLGKEVWADEDTDE